MAFYLGRLLRTASVELEAHHGSRIAISHHGQGGLRVPILYRAVEEELLVDIRALLHELCGFEGRCIALRQGEPVDIGEELLLLYSCCSVRGLRQAVIMKCI